ncbi:uncharacterized protein LOC111368325 [Olea europaea var. sylvestris]|uniref:uncharacterized protein LOC111368325 n=1 Tax=Olea europaea var. sylvestris TaxID=158386 RepID=UPI000C1CEC4A|nr:uncharacterized protein LOC111368325 [Olea europaea var. sylvestris]
MSVDVMQLTNLELELEPRGRLVPVEELEVVELEHGKAVTIGRDLKANLWEEIINWLSRNIDVFAWKVKDMPGIDPEVAVHKLNISPRAKPVKQRKRQFAPKRRVVIQEEVGKLLGSGVHKGNLNKACPKDSYPLPMIDNLVDSTSGHKLYSFLDAFSGYHQILMAKEDQEKTSFMADSAIYCYRVMSFGLKNAEATYQRLINKVLADLIGKNIETYVDDMVVKSKKVEEHISDLEEVFVTLRTCKMKLNPEKCVFGVVSGKFLGFMITHWGIEANPDKIQALEAMESPRTKKEVQKLTGWVVALNKFMARAANRCFPFFKALGGNYCFEWNEELSGVLVKEVNRAQQPIYYPLKHILQKPDISRRLLKWAIELGEFDIEFKPCPSIKAQALADFIAKLTPRPRGPDVSSSLTTGVWKIFIEGASNSSGSSTGVIIISMDMLINIQCALRFEFEATNNEAKYEAVIIAMELAINLELENIKIYSDSQLVVGQIEGTFDRKDEKMSLYCLKVHDLQRKFKSCGIVKITPAENCKVDALSRLMFMGIDGLNGTVHVRIVTEPSINQTIGIMDIDNEPSWMDPIVDFIKYGNLPQDPRATRSIRSKASRYCMIEGVLFRRSLTLPYLRCLRPSESSQALEEVHEGICGNHQGARALAFKLIRYGYYWPTMKKDVQEYVKKYDKCQRFSDIIHHPAEDLANISCTAAFEQWGIDILGPFPITKGKLKFVAVAVEYFTKWVEAEALATISEPKLRSFIWRSIICRFGIPKVLITDNSRQFDNAQFKNFCSNQEVDHCLTSVSHPQSNGIVEMTNQIILQDLRTRIGDARGSWSDELLSILWTYRTSYRTARRKTSFMLAFGIEATIHIEVRWPSKRRLEPDDAERTTEHLDVLEKVRDQAALRMASYQDKIAKYFNKKVRTWRFRAGDLVLRRTEAAGHAPSKELKPCSAQTIKKLCPAQATQAFSRASNQKALPHASN